MKDMTKVHKLEILVILCHNRWKDNIKLNNNTELNQLEVTKVKIVSKFWFTFLTSAIWMNIRFS